MTATEGQTTTLSGVAIISDPVTETGEGVLHLMLRVQKSLERESRFSWAKVQAVAFDAVAALIARNAELEAERDEQTQFLRKLLDDRGYRTDGTPAELLARFGDMVREDRDVIAAHASNAAEYIKQNAALAAENKALREAAGLALEYWGHRQQRYKNRSPAWVQATREALARTPAKENDDG